MESAFMSLEKYEHFLDFLVPSNRILLENAKILKTYGNFNPLQWNIDSKEVFKVLWWDVVGKEYFR